MSTSDRQPAPPLPWYAQAARIVALLSVAFLLVAAYFVATDPANAARWEAWGGGAFTVALMAVMVLFVGRRRSRQPR